MPLAYNLQSISADPISSHDAQVRVEYPCKMNSGKACRIIASFSFGYLLGYLTLSMTSQYQFDSESILYDTLDDTNTADDATNVASLRHVHKVLERSERDCTEPPMGESNVMYGYSYLLVLYYFEQMNNALKNLLRLGPIAMNLDMKIVEPFVVHSRLYGLPDMLPPGEVTGSFYSLHTLFKIDSINQSLNTYANASLASFEDFVQYAPRDIVVVYFIHKEQSRPRTFRLSYRYLQLLKLLSESETPAIDCTNEIFYEEQIYGGLLGTLLNITVKYGVINFRIVKFICVAGERDTTTDQLRELLGPKKKTVIIPEWRGCGYKHCNLEMHHDYMTHSRPNLLYTLKGEKRSQLNISYVYSDLVMETANLFIKNLDLTKKLYISVYMRIEKLLKTNNTFHTDKGYLKCCTSTLQKVLASVKNKFKLSNILLITDLGRYGSDSCSGNCQLMGADILKDVEKTNKIKVFNYDPDKTPLKIDNSGFAAMVEMEMLARARRLITVGSGQFKEQLIQLYGKRNKNANIYSICRELHLNVLHEFGNLPSHC